MLNLILNIVLAILKAVLPAILTRSPDTAEDAQKQPELKKRLQDRVKAHWWATILLMSAIWFPIGCGGGIRTIYVPSGEPVRLRETIRGANIWTLDKDGKPVPGKMDLPEGWYVLPDGGSQ